MAGQRLVTPEQVKLIVSAVMFSEFGDNDRNFFNDISTDRSSRVN
jgi:hypothetical protein